MKKNLIFLLIFGLIILSISACGANSNDGNINSTVESKASAPQMGAPSFSTEPVNPIAADTNNIPANEQNFEVANQTRYIIYNGEINIQAEDILEAEKKIKQLVEEVGGFIVEARADEDDTRYFRYYNFRIPAEDFQTTMNNIIELKLGKIITNRQNSSDVTEEYLDIEARIKAKRAYEERLLQLFQQANKTEDLLKIS